MRADEYVVEVFNDQMVNGVSYDFFNVEFSSNFNPPLQVPLNVNGTQYNVGLFSLTFRAKTSNLYSDSLLPTSLSLSNFDNHFGFLSDSVEGVPKVTIFVSSLNSFSPVPGNYDLNNVVDANDYSTWKASFGSTVRLAADGNGNGVVDAADYTVWRDSLMTISTSGVPEPSSIVLFAIITLACYLTCPRIQRSLAIG